MKYYLLLLSLVVFLIPFNRKVQLISDTAPYITKQESKKQHERENMKRDFTYFSCFLKLTASNCDNNPQPEKRVGTIKKEGNSTNVFFLVRVSFSDIAEVHFLCALRNRALHSASFSSLV